MLLSEVSTMSINLVSLKGLSRSFLMSSFLILGALLLGVCLIAPEKLGLIQTAYGQSVDQDDDFDRFDGRGKSGKRVDVIEWAGNLEIHVYPKGSLVGLSLQLDKKNKDKPVMVIGYRFNHDPNKQYVRRAILGVPFYAGFHTYKVTNTDEYDKVIISNHQLSGDVVAMTLDQPQKQLYPDGHPMLAEKDSKSGRVPAQAGYQNTAPVEQKKSTVDEHGTIKPFFW